MGGPGPPMDDARRPQGPANLRRRRPVRRRGPAGSGTGRGRGPLSGAASAWLAAAGPTKP